MDRLDEITGVAEPLLRRVDGIVTDLGAPAQHHLWTHLRRVRLLPTDAVRAVAALRPAHLDVATPQLRRRARDYADIAASLPGPGGWEGEAADAYAAGRRRMAEHLSHDPESLAERLQASADLGDALVDWMRQARADVSRALADVLASAEAALLSGTPATPAAIAPAAIVPGGVVPGGVVPGGVVPGGVVPGGVVPAAIVSGGVDPGRGGPPSDAEVLAAADIAARVLRTVADAYDAAEGLLSGSAGLSAAGTAPPGCRTAESL